MKIGSASAERGEKTYGFLKVTTKPDGTDVGIHVIIVNGSENGPVLLVDGVHHGSEHAGYEAILRLANELDPAKLGGTFIGVPILNVDSFQARTRIGLMDSQDMNRVYPGRRNGTATEQIVFTYLNEIIPKADYLITCHGARDERSPVTYVGCPAWDESETVKKSIELACIFGTEIITKRVKPSYQGRLMTLSVEKGVPIILPEIGGTSDIYENRWHYVSLMIRGIKNVMKHLNMIEGEPELPQRQIVARNDILSCKHGGLWIPEVKGSPEKPGAQKQYVKKGTVLGRVMSPFNIEDELECIEAPYDGLVIGLYYHPVVYPGDTVIYFGDILEEIENI